MPDGKGTPGWLNNFATSGNRTLHAPAELDIINTDEPRWPARTALFQRAARDASRDTMDFVRLPPPQARRESALRLGLST